MGIWTAKKNLCKPTSECSFDAVDTKTQDVYVKNYTAQRYNRGPKKQEAKFNMEVIGP